MVASTPQTTMGRGALGKNGIRRGEVDVNTLALLPLSLLLVLLIPLIAAPTSGKSKSKSLGRQVKALPRATAAAGGGNWHFASKLLNVSSTTRPLQHCNGLVVELTLAKVWSRGLTYHGWPGFCLI
jgi:hypothetical protein